MELYIVKTLTIRFNYSSRKYTFDKYEPDGIIKGVFIDKHVAIDYGVKEAKKYLHHKLSQNADNIPWHTFSLEPDKLNDNDKVTILNKLCNEIVCVEVWKQIGENRRLSYCHTLHNINTEQD
jgi:hypothetical protein